MSDANYIPTIGLEVHVQLNTQTKLFAGDANAYGNEPNTNISVITLAHPGTLPMLNKAVVEKAIKLGIATDSEINRKINFDRKNYFYPDLPKGYQITQDKHPICRNGKLKVRANGSQRYIKIHKIHIEEDAGKSIHMGDDPFSLVDLNRAGVPLLEIVTEPDIHSAEEAAAFFTEMRKLVRYLGICDGNLEHGSMRCDANISVRKGMNSPLGKKVEVKNMNSMRFLTKAIRYEIERQTTLLNEGNEVISETRTFNFQDGKTYGMRTKEELNDYRYLPDPDLTWFEIEDSWLKDIQMNLPELPEVLFQKFTETYQIPTEDARILTEEQSLALFYDKTCSQTRNFKAIANLLIGPVRSHLNESGRSIEDLKLSSVKLIELVDMVEEGKVSKSAMNQQIIPYLLKYPDMTPSEVVVKLNLQLETNTLDVQSMINEVLQTFPDKVKAYRNGKKGLVGLFMGEVMKKTSGKADPKEVNKMIVDTLEKVEI